ncbi:MAG: thiamine pyrophosphate-dependent enzyme [Bacteroidota bacterium]
MTDIEKRYLDFCARLYALEYAVSLHANENRKRFIHLSFGHELSAYLIAEELRPEKWPFFLYYRSHAWALALGVPMTTILKAVLGMNADDIPLNGGSMHLTLHNQILDCNSIVGAQIPISLGASMVTMCKGNRSSVVTVLGDGTTNTGVFFESLNIVSLFKLPILFVVENNFKSIEIGYKNTSSISVKNKFQAFNIPVLEIDEAEEDMETIISKVALAMKIAKSNSCALIFQMQRITDHNLSQPINLREIISANKYADLLADRFDSYYEKLNSFLINHGIKSSN